MDSFIGMQRKLGIRCKVICSFSTMFARDMDFCSTAQRDKFNDLDKKLLRSPARTLLSAELERICMTSDSVRRYIFGTKYAEREVAL